MRVQIQEKSSLQIGSLRSCWVMSKIPLSSKHMKEKGTVRQEPSRYHDLKQSSEIWHKARNLSPEERSHLPQAPASGHQFKDPIRSRVPCSKNSRVITCSQPIENSPELRRAQCMESRDMEERDATPKKDQIRKGVPRDCNASPVGQLVLPTLVFGQKVSAINPPHQP